MARLGGKRPPLRLSRPWTTQAAFQLSNEQQEMVCDAYEALMAALEQAAADQDAFLAGRPQHPGALWIAQNVSAI